MPILCEPASTAGELLSGIDGEVRKADTLGAAAKLLDSDPNETLVVIGPRAVTSDALAFAAALRLARPGRRRHPGPQGSRRRPALPGDAVRHPGCRAGRRRRRDGGRLPPLV